MHISSRHTRRWGEALTPNGWMGCLLAISVACVLLATKRVRWRSSRSKRLLLVTTRRGVEGGIRRGGSSKCTRWRLLRSPSLLLCSNRLLGSSRLLRAPYSSMRKIRRLLGCPCCSCHRCGSLLLTVPSSR